jgi:hypothetical protein
MSTSRLAPARVVRGHQVASGLNGDPRFPGGTIRMQRPHFATLGLDLGALHPATLNVSLAPLSWQARQPAHTFRALRWHPTEPAEDFSFFHLRLHREGGPPVDGWIYLPHPQTKPEHFQSPDVLELLLPWIDGLTYGSRVQLEVPEQEMTFRP